MFKTILVAIDIEHGDHNRRVLSAAKAIADANGADVHLLNVVAAAPAIVSQFLHENYEQMASGQAKQALAALESDLDLKAGKVASSIRFGTVYDEVIAAAETVGADLIVTGSHKPNVSDYLLGSNASRVVRHAACSVLVVR
jgi:nucleotide-binding universal stress UspA family protein